MFLEHFCSENKDWSTIRLIKHPLLNKWINLMNSLATVRHRTWESACVCAHHPLVMLWSLALTVMCELRQFMNEYHTSHHTFQQWCNVEVGFCSDSCVVAFNQYWEAYSCRKDEALFWATPAYCQQCETIYGTSLCSGSAESVSPASMPSSEPCLLYTHSSDFSTMERSWSKSDLICL